MCVCVHMYVFVCVDRGVGCRLGGSYVQDTFLELQLELNVIFTKVIISVGLPYTFHGDIPVHTQTVTEYKTRRAS